MFPSKLVLSFIIASGALSEPLHTSNDSFNTRLHFAGKDPKPRHEASFRRKKSEALTRGFILVKVLASEASSVEPFSKTIGMMVQMKHKASSDHH